MSPRHTVESFAVLALVLALTLPGVTANLVGGDIPNCDTIQLGTIPCSALNSACSGNVVVCEGCGEGTKSLLCGSCGCSSPGPCGGGAALCSALRNSKQAINPEGQACVPDACENSN